MRERSQAVAQILSAARRSISRARPSGASSAAPAAGAARRRTISRAAPRVLPAAAILALTAFVLVSSSGPGPGSAPGNSASPVNGWVAGASPTGSATAGGSTDPVLPWPVSKFGPAPSTAPKAIPTGTCVPGYLNRCATVAAPTPMGPGPVGTGDPFTLHVPILEYHRIKPLAGEKGYVADLITPPEFFTAQMKAMARAGWHTITMGEVGDYLRLGIQPNPKAFVVTFDDGYEDGYTYAYPILRRYGFVATYFVVGNQIGKPDHLTVAELRALVAANCEIGNHTLDHVDLQVQTPEHLVGEIYGNSALIARDTGVWPQSFAYPIGLTTPQVIAVIASTPGLETAVVQDGKKPETWANRWQLPRIRVGSGTYPQDLVQEATKYLP